MDANTMRLLSSYQIGGKKTGWKFLLFLLLVNFFLLNNVAPNAKRRPTKIFILLC